MAKKYRVTLTADERDELERLLARGKADVRKIKHAQILLKADEAQGGPGWPDERMAEAFDAGITTVERVRRRFVEEGLASALSPYRGGKRIYERKLDGAQEAHLIALACSAPPNGRAPNGRARWTLRLLAQRMVELAYVDTLSHETVRQTLKKMRSSRTRGGCGASPRSPRRSSSSTWRMSSRSTTARTTPSAPWCAWTRPSSS
jgi:transposase